MALPWGSQTRGWIPPLRSLPHSVTGTHGDRQHTQGGHNHHDNILTCMHEPMHLGIAYTSSQPLHGLEDTHVFTPPTHVGGASPYTGEAPAPYPWAPKFLPEQWVYIDGLDITGHHRLGAAVMHIPTNTTIYIYAAGTEETRTIMRADLVAIHTALFTFSTRDWIGVFTEYLSSLHIH